MQVSAFILDFIIIYTVTIYLTSPFLLFLTHLIRQGKDSSNYSAEDMGCILGTKSEKVTTIFLNFVLLRKIFHGGKLF